MLFRSAKTKKMGFDSFPTVNQVTQHELTLLDNENLSKASPRIDSLGRSRCRRSSIRRCNILDAEDAKKNGFDQKSAAKLPQSTLSRNGTKDLVRFILNY